jgi:hypothetical protein
MRLGMPSMKAWNGASGAHGLCRRGGAARPMVI